MAGYMDMYFHDVGQGDCTSIEASDGNGTYEFYLIDFGFKEREFNGDSPPEDTKNVLADLITDYSKKRALPAPYIDHLFITHPDGDHWNMLSDLITGTVAGKKSIWEQRNWPKNSTLSVGTLTYGGTANEYRGKGGVRKTRWDNIVKAAINITGLGNLEHAIQDPNNGNVNPTWQGLNGNLNIYLINSNNPTKAGGAPNPKSLCLIFEYDGTRLMLLGDAEPTAIGADLQNWYGHNNNEFLACDVLKLSHHGSRNGTPPGWADIFQPRYAFVSGDYRWAHPYCAALNNIRTSPRLSKNREIHWITCHNDNVGNYFPSQTKEAIYGTLWYAVTTAKPQTAKNEFDKKLTYNTGQYIGVTWLLEKIEGKALGDPIFAPDDVWPGTTQVPVTAVK